VQFNHCNVHIFFFPPEETNSLLSRTPYISRDNDRRDNKHSSSSAHKKLNSDTDSKTEEMILLASSESPSGAIAAQAPPSNKSTDFPIAEIFSGRKPRTLTCRVKRKYNFYHNQTGLAVKP
jgi:hypothetical protein